MTSRPDTAHSTINGKLYELRRYAERISDLESLSDDVLDGVAGGLSDSKKRELDSNITLAKFAGNSMEWCINASTRRATGTERDEIEAYIRANW